MYTFFGYAHGCTRCWRFSLGILGVRLQYDVLCYLGFCFVSHSGPYILTCFPPPSLLSSDHSCLTALFLAAADCIILLYFLFTALSCGDCATPICRVSHIYHTHLSLAILNRASEPLNPVCKLNIFSCSHITQYL